jgi:hypothetical protein
MDLPPPPDDRGPIGDSAPRRLSFERIEPAALATDPASLARAIVARTGATYRARLSACWLAYWGEALGNWSIVATAIAVISGINDALGDPALLELSRFASFLVQILVPVWLQIGLTMILLKLARQRPVAVEDLFRGGRFLLTKLLANALFLAVAAIPVLAAYLAIDAFLARFPSFSSYLGIFVLLSAAQAPLPVLESLNRSLSSEWSHGVDLALMTIVITVGLGSIPILVLLARLGQFGYLIFDRNAGVLESLRGSWRLTRGRLTTVCLMYVTSIAINLAGLLAFCVGLFFTLPLTDLLLATTYDALIASSPEWEPLGPEDAEAGDRVDGNQRDSSGFV